MTTLKTNAIEPEGATTNLTVGMTGQNVVVGGSGGIKANTFKDAGGNTLWTSNGSGVLSSVSGFGGAQVLIQSQTASNSASLSFTSGITSTYKEYVFEFFNINPATDQYLTINFSSDGGSNYNMDKTTTFLEAYHYESNSSGLIYQASYDLAQSAAGQPISQHIGSGADECMAGELHLYNPANTTHVKNFYSRVNNYAGADISQNAHVGGYVNSTTAINAVQFAMSSGNFDGKIKMYGVK